MDETGSKYDREVMEWHDNIVNRMRSAGVHMFCYVNYVHYH